MALEKSMNKACFINLKFLEINKIKAETQKWVPYKNKIHKIECNF